MTDDFPALAAEHDQRLADIAATLATPPAPHRKPDALLAIPRALLPALIAAAAGLELRPEAAADLRHWINDTLENMHLDQLDRDTLRRWLRLPLKPSRCPQP